MIETSAVLALGTIWFWVLVGVGILLMFVWVEYSQSFLAGLSILIILLLLKFLGDVDAFGYIARNPSSVLGIAAGYFVIGPVWSFGKWWFYVRKQKEAYDEAYALFQEMLQQYGSDKDWQRRETKEQFIMASKPKIERYKPSALRNKNRVLTWMIYWPWSMAWTLISDPIKDIFEAIFRKLQSTYQGIADRAFQDAERREDVE